MPRSSKVQKQTTKASKTSKTPKYLNEFVQGWDGRVNSGSPAVVKISWIDACVDSNVSLDPTPGWVERYGVGGVVMQTCGYLLYKGAHWTVVQQERHAEANLGFRRVQQIPTENICEIKVYEEATSGN